MENLVSDEELFLSLKRIERFSVWMDSRFRVPFTQIRFGFDSLIGVVPFIGEVIGLILSMYLIAESYRLKLPLSLKVKMLGNVIFDCLVGIIPVLGDIADVAFKANIRNRNILVAYVNSLYLQRHKPLIESEHLRNKKIYFSLMIISICVLAVFLSHYLAT